MKLVTIALSAFSVSCLFSVSSWAFPETGDFVQFVAMYEGSPVVMEKRVLFYDPADKMCKVKTIMTYKERVIQEQTVMVPDTFLYNLEKIQDVLRNCEAREGVISDVTVDGKSFQVCEFYNEDSQLTSMIGPVPFGLVRYQVYLEGETFLDFNLTKFILGK
jgi:hypothetical protein